MTDSEKLDLLIKKMETVDEKIETMDKKIEVMGKKIETMDKRIETMEEKIETMDKKIDVLTERADKTDADISEIKLSIENNITKQITLIAEGHMMIMDKFDEALAPGKKLEMMQLQISILEEKVRKLERRVPA